jgi:hypothetical protein
MPRAMGGGGESKARGKGQGARGKNRSTTKQKLVSNTFGTGLLYVPYVLWSKKTKFERKRETKQGRPTEGKTTKPLAQKRNYQ